MWQKLQNLAIRFIVWNNNKHNIRTCFDRQTIGGLIIKDCGLDNFFLLDNNILNPTIRRNKFWGSNTEFQHNYFSGINMTHNDFFNTDLSNSKFDASVLSFCDMSKVSSIRQLKINLHVHNAQKEELKNLCSKIDELKDAHKNLQLLDESERIKAMAIIKNFITKLEAAKIQTRDGHNA